MRWEYKVDTDGSFHTEMYFICIGSNRMRQKNRQLWLVLGEGNGTPLQYCCVENPMDGEPGRLQSMGSLRVGHDWVTSLSLFTFMHWRRKWQPTPVFLPGESHGRRSLVGCSPWGRTVGHDLSDAATATNDLYWHVRGRIQGSMWTSFFFFNRIYLCLASLGLCCCVGFSLVAESGGCSPVAVC